MSKYGVCASGDMVAAPAAIQSAGRVWQPSVSTFSGEPSHRTWYSWLNEKRCFGVGCAVIRPMYIVRPCDWRAVTLLSGAQSHLLRSKALALATMPSTFVSVFSLR